MEYTENLKAWLRFNDSTTADVCGNSWTATGSPSVSSQNAKNGNALQLDGNSHITLSGLPLCGQAFTLDLWVYANSSTPSNGRVISIINPTTGNMLFSLRRRSTTLANSAQLEIYSSTNKDAAQDSGSVITLGVNTTLNNLIHFALVYTGTGNQASVYVNGSRAYVSTVVHSRLNCDIVVGAKTDNTQGLIGTIDELRIYDGVQLYNNSFTPPSANEYDGFDFYFDAQRKVINPPLTWFYKNPGRADLLTTANGTTVTGLTAEQSITGVGFYQPDRTACFGISATKEIWIRCDVYTTENYANNNRLRIYSDDSSGTNGWATNATINSKGAIWHNSTSQTSTNVDYLGKNKNRSILLHMKSGSSDGLIEISLKNLTTGVISTDTYSGNVNAGNDFANVYIQMDGSNIYVSNLIISNVELTFETSYIYPVFDAIRMPKIPATLWQYENAGTTADLINTNTAVQVNNLPQSQSKTGSAFYQTTENIALFDIATNTPEIWIKFDVYSQGYGWDVQDYTFYQDDSTKVVGIMSLLHFVPNSYIRFFNYDGNVYGSIADVELSEEIDDTLRTFILHMKADSTNGIIELFSDIEGLIYSFSGAVNGGTPFSKIDFVSDVDNGKADLFSNVIISNNPLWFYDNVSADISVSFSADTQRKISQAEIVTIDIERVVDRSWRYENYGTADLLKVAGNTVNNLPLNKSAIGMAFWQSGREGCFDIPATKELWAKWDLYYTGTAKWRVYDRKDSKDTGVARMNSTTSLVCYINGPLQVDVKPAGTITQGARKTYLLHMVSDATDGYIELWIDGVKYYSNNFQSQGLIYKGNVNDGDAFNNFYMQSDNNSNLFSNVIISNRQIGLSENVWDIVEADAERSLYQSILLDVDLVRAVTINSIPVDFDVDLCRAIGASQSLDLDAERSIAVTYDFSVDCERVLDGVLTLLVDAERKVGNVVDVNFDREWLICRGMSLSVDVDLHIRVTVNFTADVFRKIPYKITDTHTPPTPPEPTPGVVPPADRSAFLQSCTISLNEQQLTDSITFVFNGTCEIMDAVDFQLLDYSLHGRIEETMTKGVMTSCKCTVDIDAILYQQLAYSVPESKWEYTEEYTNYVHSKGGCIRTDPGYEDAELKATPSAPASAHITEIAAKLGKSVSLHFTDFISTMSTDVKSGTNYAGLLQELFGWTARLPHIMINCYIRGNTIYVVQRGQEQNTVTLDGQKLTVHTVNKKLVRTTWGSDPWSKTEVKPYFNEWTEGVKEPLPDEGGESGTEYNDEGLIEETTVQHGDETVVTHYYYETLENGQKFLYQEVATTYNNGSKVDEVTTYHDPVRDTQSHVYSVDSDGVLGGVVTSSNNDDRRTPWQNAKSSFQGGILVSDMDGNRYLLKELIYHSDKGEMARRTINGVSLIDTSFPVEGESMLQALTNQIMWLDRRTEETVTVDVYDYPHLIDFNDKIVFGGNTYHLRSNTVTINEKIVNRQSLEFVRWY